MCGLTSVDGELTRVVVIGADTPQSEAGQDLVRRIRADILPAAGIEGALVGGQGANDLDLTDEIAERLPWVIGGVLLGGVGAYVVAGHIGDDQITVHIAR